MIKELLKDGQVRMGKSIESFANDLTKIRTGRAHTSLLDHITVDYYGSPTPLSQAANVSVEDARTLSVTAWDKSMIGAIEKAILESDLGLNPATAGTVIRIPIPALTEDRRKDLIKIVKAEAEKARIAIRNIRRDVINDVKSLEKDKEISQDEQKKAESDIQDVTDKKIDEVDAILADKEKELMEI
ncbi:MAG: ribosome recycling factor [Gammaproteobacteria bacterium]